MAKKKIRPERFFEGDPKAFQFVKKPKSKPEEPKPKPKPKDRE